MRILAFAKRNFKEIIRDPLSIVFAILLPLVLLILFEQIKIPNELYRLEYFTPSIIIFSLSFITLFTATLVAKDRGTSLLTRLFISPMRSWEYIFGYALLVIPLVVIQCVVFISAALIMGLEFTVNAVAVVLLAVVISLLFIMLGILLGSITNEKSASGISSIVVQLVAFTSGMYFSSEMLGKGFNTVCKILPFLHCLELVKYVFNGGGIKPTNHILIFGVYTVIITAVTAFVFQRKMVKG